MGTVEPELMAGQATAEQFWVYLLEEKDRLFRDGLPVVANPELHTHLGAPVALAGQATALQELKK